MLDGLGTTLQKINAREGMDHFPFYFAHAVMFMDNKAPGRIMWDTDGMMEAPKGRSPLKRREFVQTGGGKFDDTIPNDLLSCNCGKLW